MCLRDLKPADVKGPGRDGDNTGEGHHKLSWIWLNPRDGGLDPVLDGDIDESKFAHSVL
jgi:hypothetical protein